MNRSSMQRSRQAKIVIRTVGCLLLAGVATIAVAQGEQTPDWAVRVVKVPSTTMPWDTRINSRFDFGMHNGRPPVTVFDRNLRPAIKVRFSVTGTTATVGGGGGTIPAEGQKDFPTASQPEFGWPRFPSRYFAKGEKTSYLNGIVAAFVDADGRIVGKPFPVGKEAERLVPDGAIALVMGLDDDNFSDNSGTLTVTLRMPQPKVSVE